MGSQLYAAANIESKASPSSYGQDGDVVLCVCMGGSKTTGCVVLYERYPLNDQSVKRDSVVWQIIAYLLRPTH